MGKSVLSTIGSIMEVAQPLSQGEQNFKALHGPLEPKKDLVPGVTDQDHIFNGTPRKEDPKTASYENFRDDDESKEAYDKTLKVSEEPETDKDVKEEVEQVEEVTAVEEETLAVDEAMKGEAEYNARYGAGGKKRPPLDPVGKEDSDVNNDGKVDSSDSYLSNKRKVISKYLKKEDTEVVSPVSKKEVEEETSFAKTDWKAILTKKAVAEEKFEEEVEEIVESLKLIKTYKAGEHTAKVYKDNDWDEHRVKFFSGDKHHKDSDYHTDDADDAHDTAKTQLKSIAKKAIQEQIDLELNEKKNMDIWSAVVSIRNQKNSIDEESEQIDEISRGLATRYIQKAKTSTRDAYYGDDVKSSNKRSKGIDLALKKKWGDKNYGLPEPKVKATEEVEHLDEVSNKMKADYVTAAAHDLTDRAKKHGKSVSEKDPIKGGSGLSSDDIDNAFKISNRQKGIAQAVRSMKKEDIEQVDEKHLTPAEKKKREEIAQAIARKNPDMPMGKKMAIATAQAKKVAEDFEQVDEAQFSRDQLNSAMSALEKTKKAASAEKDTKKRTQHLMRQNFLTKQLSYMRSAISSEGMKAKMAEEFETFDEAVDVDVNMHEFMAGKAKRAIDVLKKNNRPIPDELLRTYEKHKQEIEKFKKDVGKQRNEGVDFATARSDRGAVKTYVKYGKDGKTELVSRRDPRKEIKIGEEAEQVDEAKYSAKAARAGEDIGKLGKNFANIAKDAAKRYGSKERGEKVAGSVLANIRKKNMKEALNNDNMMQASVDKLKKDPLVSKENVKLPPSQGLKAIGGDEQVHPTMAEERLNKLYESLSNKNKIKFVEMLELDDGIDKLLKFAESQGF